MNISRNGVDLIKEFEGFRANAYQDSVGVWTIGYGTIVYENGVKVKKGDVVSIQRATDLLMWEINMKTNVLNHIVTSHINQNQFDALASITYNIGEGAIRISHLLQYVNANSQDPRITGAFLVWDKGHVNGKLVELPGLLSRRRLEAAYYFKT